MKTNPLTGTVIPRFEYDTPTAPACDFYRLCEGEGPLVMVFLANFGHPISREYLTRYLQSFDRLQSGRLACVVRSAPQKIAEVLNGASFPFELICDADGVLYEHFGVKYTKSVLDWTPQAGRIFRQARAAGYERPKGEPQLLPLTLVVGAEGRVLYAHQGESLTDLPEDCAAVEQVCLHLAEPQPEPAAEPQPADQEAPVPQPEALPEGEPAAESAPLPEAPAAEEAPLPQPEQEPQPEPVEP